MSPSIFDKLRVPIGSLVVDASLVVALIWWGATMTERLDQMTRRIDRLAGIDSQVQADRRLAIIETTVPEQARRLDRIEGKIDLLIERQAQAARH